MRRTMYRRSDYGTPILLNDERCHELPKINKDIILLNDASGHGLPLFNLNQVQNQTYILNKKYKYIIHEHELSPENGLYFIKWKSINYNKEIRI
jgi:hypothetical protein